MARSSCQNHPRNLRCAGLMWVGPHPTTKRKKNSLSPKCFIASKFDHLPLVTDLSPRRFGKRNINHTYKTVMPLERSQNDLRTHKTTVEVFCLNVLVG